MAGVNNVSTTFDNAPENSHNTAVERTATTCTTTNLHHKAADDSDDQDSDSLQNVIDDELSRRLQTETPGGDSAALECAADLQCPPPSAAAADVNHDAVSYRVQKDASERMLLTETRHAEETGRLLIGPAIVSDSGPDDKNDDGPPPPPSDGSEDDDVAAVVVPDLAATADPPAADEQRRVFVRPPPADETDNVQTELVFDTWTTADEDAVRESDAPKSETNGLAEECYSDISRAAPNPECFVDVNAPAIVTNAITEIVSETTSERKTVKKKSLSSAGGGDSSTTTVVKTKKTKKSKKNDEKENISVKLNGHSTIDTTCSQFDDCPVEEDDLSNVCVRDLKKSYCDEANRKSSSVVPEEPVPASVPIDELKRNFVGAIETQPSGCENELMNGCSKSSFGKFDQLEKKAILQQQRSPESEKSDAKQNGVLRSEVNSVCKSCEKTVYAMEQIKAERQVWHKNCFRCTTCNKQLTLDIYSSHEGVLYCKPHFKELFKPKVVVEDEEPTSDKPDLGLEELSSLNVKSRYQAFENATTNGNSSMEKSPVSVKRSPSILSKLAKFQSKGMDVGISNEALNGAFFEPSSSSESGDEDTGNGVMMKNSISKEKPMSFDKMESVKRNWEMRREEMKEEHKQEIQNIRSKLFAGKQGKMKQMYEQAVAESERTGVKRDLNVNKSDKAKVMKERFEKGELLNNEDTELDENNSSVPTNGIDDEMSVFEAGISKKSRSLFMEMDANAVKTKHSAPVVSPKKEYTPTKQGESPERDIYRDPNIVRNEDPVDETAELVKSNTTAKMLSLFRQMEVAKPAVPEGPKPLKCFTPPPDYKESETESETDEDDSGDESGEEDSSSSETNGDVIKSSVKVEDEFLKNAQNAVMARSLKEKFEHWEPDKHSLNNAVTMLDSEQESIESTKSLRARFESYKSDRSIDKPKPKVNRFVSQTDGHATALCESCEKKVYPLEKVEIEGRPFHRACFRCSQCQCVLRMDTFTWNKNRLYCLPHFKRLFISKGNYDEGFGDDQHKKKWENGHIPQVATDSSVN